MEWIHADNIISWYDDSETFHSSIWSFDDSKFFF